MDYSEIKGLVVGTKNDSAILVVRPDGRTVVAVGSGKRFGYMVSRMTQGGWVCVHGAARQNGRVVEFAENAEVAIGMEAVQGDRTMRIICTNYCDAETTGGWCFETAEDQWTRMVAVFGEACRAAEEMEAA